MFKVRLLVLIFSIFSLFAAADSKINLLGLNDSLSQRQVLNLGNVDYLKLFMDQYPSSEKRAATEASLLAQEFFSKNGLQTREHCSQFHTVVEKWKNENVDEEVLVYSWASTKSVMKVKEILDWLQSNPQASWNEVKNQKFSSYIPNPELLKYVVAHYRSDNLFSKFFDNASLIGEKSAQFGFEKEINSLRRSQRVLAAQIFALSEEFPEYFNYFDIIENSKYLEQLHFANVWNAKVDWQNSYFYRLGRFSTGIGETTAYSVAPLFFYGKSILQTGTLLEGTKEAADFISKTQQERNRGIFGSALGSDEELAGSSNWQLLLNTNPIVQAGGALGTVAQAPRAGYENWSEFVLGGGKKNFDELSKDFPELKWGTRGVYLFEFGASGGLFLWGRGATVAGKLGTLSVKESLAISAAQSAVLKRPLIVAGAFSATAATGLEFFEAGKPTGQFSGFRWAENTVSGTSGSMLFAGSLSTLWRSVGGHTSPYSARAFLTTRGIDFVEATGDLPDTTYMFQNSHNKTQQFGSILIAGVNLFDTFDSTIMGAFSKMNYQGPRKVTVDKKKFKSPVPPSSLPIIPTTELKETEPTGNWMAVSTSAAKFGEMRASRNMLVKTDSEVSLPPDAQGFVEGFESWLTNTLEKEKSFGNKPTVIRILTQKNSMEFTPIQVAELKAVAKKNSVSLNFETTKLETKKEFSTLDDSEKIELEDKKELAMQALAERMQEAEESLKSENKAAYEQAREDTRIAIEREIVDQFFKDNDIPINDQVVIRERIKNFFKPVTSLYETPDKIQVIAGLTKATLSAAITISSWKGFGISFQDPTSKLLLAKLMGVELFFGPYLKIYLNWIDRVDKWGGVAAVMGYNHLQGFVLMSTDKYLLHLLDPAKITGPWDPAYLLSFVSLAAIGGALGSTMPIGINKLISKGYMKAWQGTTTMQALDVFMSVEAVFLAVGSPWLVPLYVTHQASKYSIFVIGSALPPKSMITLVQSKLLKEEIVQKQYRFNTMPSSEIQTDPTLTASFLNSEQYPTELKLELLNYTFKVYQKSHAGQKENVQAEAVLGAYYSFFSENAGSIIAASERIEALIEERKNLSKEHFEGKIEYAGSGYTARALSINRKAAIKSEIKQLKADLKNFQKMAAILEKVEGKDQILLHLRERHIMGLTQVIEEEISTDELDTDSSEEGPGLSKVNSKAPVR